MTTAAANPARCWGVIPAAGTGSRMAAELPKQYMKLAGSTVLEHSLAALLQCDFIASVVIALNSNDTHAKTLPGLRDSRVLLTTGGKHRSDSVLAGLKALETLASPQDWVLVHDAARPCVSPADIARLAQRVFEAGRGGILALPVLDTVKRSDSDNNVVETPPREHLWYAQTPQMFRLGRLRAALENVRINAFSVTDEASAMELAGEGVQLVTGSADNLKITFPEDLALAEFYLSRGREDSQ